MPIPDKPRFRGTVTYAPSPTGLATPVPRARVRIWDKDASGDDLLVDVTADKMGRFDKRATTAWRDAQIIRNGVGGSVTVPDVTDVPIFFVRIDDPTTNNWLKAPYAYMGDGIPVPLVVNWPSPLITINGEIITFEDGPVGIVPKVVELAKARAPISFRLGAEFSKFTIPFMNGKVDHEKFQAMIGDKLNLPGYKNLTSGLAPGSVEALVVIALIIFILAVAAPLAFAHGLFLIALASAILYAVTHGYTIELRKTDSGSAGTGNSTPIPLSDIELKLTPKS